ncbi:MAG: hypothetical protein MUO61_07035 [Dehalococcoidia bacterium]|nr:hypothetical protein [Dehalococcoidia bacterium]
MSLDIVEIALDGLTDYQEFEKIASEIMRDEGYPAIKPLGGLADRGRDAIQESYFISEGRNITVFQYTLQQYLPGKIKDTIDKLSKANIKYNELVIVTPHSISTERQDQMKRDTRKKYNVNIDIYERKTIVNRLANLDNGIFHRHFPDIERQVKELTTKEPLLSSDDSTLLESAMLRSSLAFVVSERSPRVRDSIFDSLTLSTVIHSTDKDISVSDLRAKYSENMGIELPTAQLEASLKRLSSRGLLEQHQNRVSLTEFAKQSDAGVTIRANEATNALISDILDEIFRISGEKSSERDCQIIANNTRKVLIKLFRLFGIELANQVLKNVTPSAVYLDASEDLLETARNQLPPEVGELLIHVISEILRSPTKDQAETLANWSLAYLGVQIMNLDPTLRELQSTRFAKKIFVLDTDFILDCIVQECPSSSTYLNLVQTLRKLGCRVIIPESCVQECIKHAKISPRTYHHFGDKLLALGDVFVDEVVWNVFVKGYYYARINRYISPGAKFRDYLRNYYEPSAGKAFLIEVIKNRFPKGVEILDISSLLTRSIPEETMASMSEALCGVISSHIKSQYRSNDEIEELARTDAQLFLTTVYLNEESERVPHQLLGGCCYLITSSGKYLRSAKKVGLRDVVTTRPQSLIALLEIIGGIEIAPTEFVRLFENPMLIYAVSQVWSDVQALLDSGIDLRDKSIARLRWDLGQELHSRISALEEAEVAAEISKEEVAVSMGDIEFTELLKSAKARGYKKIPELDAFMQALEKAESEAREKEEAYAELIDKYKELEGAITHFGKRKQRYLRRIASRNERK